MFLGDLASYLPEHIRPFADLLKQFPINYEKWVHATSIPTEIYQGDVFENALLVHIDEEGQIAKADLPAMVISCTCDAQQGQGEFVLLAPVLNLEWYSANSGFEGTALENHMRDLMDNKIANFFFLPAGQRLPASVIDFQQITSTTLDYLKTERFKTRLTSLSQSGHYFFLVKLAHHLTRPDAPDAKRG